MGKCIICNKELTDSIFSLENMPQAVQYMPNKDNLLQDKGMELKLYQCDGCGLIQFDCTPVEYYKEVIRAGGCSNKMVNLRKKQYQHLISTYKLCGKDILEVGCGGGEFLELLQEFPVNSFGLEAAPQLIDIARSKGLNVIEGFMGEGEYIGNKFDAFLSFNFLEHQPDPNGMLQEIHDNLNEEGVGLITVPSFEYFLENASYYEFMRDHLAYYTEDTLKRLVENNGFQMLEVARFNEDTIEMIVKKRKDIVLPNFEQERSELESTLNKRITNFKKDKVKIAIWGASHQAFTLLATINLHAEVQMIIDSAPFKWNSFSPVSHVPIVPPDALNKTEVDGIIIMAPGYSDEIAKVIDTNFPNVSNVLSVKGNQILVLKG